MQWSERLVGLQEGEGARLGGQGRGDAKGRGERARGLEEGEEGRGDHAVERLRGAERRQHADDRLERQVVMEAGLDARDGTLGEASGACQRKLAHAEEQAHRPDVGGERADQARPGRSGRWEEEGIVAGGVQVNGPTYGFEPHVPFGGQRDSGTGWREPGTEALDVYSDWKTVYVTHDPASV